MFIAQTKNVILIVDSFLGESFFVAQGISLVVDWLLKLKVELCKYSEHNYH